MRTHRFRLAGAWALAPALAACTAGAVPTSGDDEAGSSIDEQAVLARLKDFRTSADFAAVNQNTYETALGTGVAIDVYVSANGHDAYSRIDADASGSYISVPETTLIVREVFDQLGGKTQTLTLMYKGPAGYNPDLGDFWFAVTDPAGEVVLENGARKAGRLEECYSCHLGRAQDGYLFGVPGSNRPGATPPDEPPPEEPPPVDEPPPAPGEEPPTVCGDFFCEGDEFCENCPYDCFSCPEEPDDDDHGGEDDDHGGEDDDQGGDDS